MPQASLNSESPAFLVMQAAWQMLTSLLTSQSEGALRCLSECLHCLHSNGRDSFCFPEVVHALFGCQQSV